MKPCVNDTVAFGLNKMEVDLVVFGIIILVAIGSGLWLILYTNQDIATKEERWARKNPSLAVDMELPPVKGKRNVL